MKTRHFASFLLILLVSGTIFFARTGYAQRATAKNNDISVDFIDYLVNNTFHLQYEWKLTSTSSFLVRLAYVTKSENPGPTTALGAGAAWRLYIIDSRALQGFSVAPAVDLFFFKNTPLGKSNILFSVGADGGYKFFFDQITLEPTLGVRIGFAPGNNLPPGESNFTGLYVVPSIYLGYAW